VSKSILTEWVKTSIHTSKFGFLKTRESDVQVHYSQYLRYYDVFD